MREKGGNEGLRIQHVQNANGQRRRYRTGIKNVDDTITTWMVTLSIPVDVNMPMNLMDVGIKDAHTVSPEIGKYSTFKEKIFSSVT